MIPMSNHKLQVVVQGPSSPWMSSPMVMNLHLVPWTVPIKGTGSRMKTQGSKVSLRNTRTLMVTAPFGFSMK